MLCIFYQCCNKYTFDMKCYKYVVIYLVLINLIVGNVYKCLQKC
jgi:hypothetical protein